MSGAGSVPAQRVVAPGHSSTPVPGSAQCEFVFAPPVTDTGVRLPQVWRDKALTEGVNRVLRNHAGAQGRGEQPIERLWNDNIEGACSECGFSLWRGIPWNPLPRPDGRYGDVAGYEVRSTPHTPGHLLLKEEDTDPERVCVLMRGRTDTWRVVGWLRVGAGRIQKYERHQNDGKLPAIRYHSWWVPAGDLHPMASLPRVV